MLSLSLTQILEVSDKYLNAAFIMYVKKNISSE